MREIQATAYDSKTYTDVNLLYKNGLVDPVQLSKNLTYLWGKDSDMFPLMTLTQGQNAFKSLKPMLANDSQYIWPVMGRMKWTTKVVGLVNTNLATPGKNFSSFDIYVEDAWIHYQYSAYTPDQKHIVRFMSEPQEVAPKKYRVTIQIMGNNPDAYIDSSNFTAGKAWSMGAPTVAAQLSEGTFSNRMTPGKMTNQFGWHRYSKEITGNISNKVVNIEFDLEGGGKTNMWLPFELKLWEMERRQLEETSLWYDEYNRDTNGVITMRDPKTNQPIPMGAGVKAHLVAAGNYDTYSTLTKAKFDSTVRSVFDNRVDDTPMEIVLYTGKGGAQEFHDMLMNEAKGYVLAMGEKVVTGSGMLEYGAYFNKYKLIDGRTITVKPVKFFDHGSRAQQDRENGRMYNGYPLSSYSMFFLDHSLDSQSGERNIMLVAEEGREEISGVYAGLTPLPAAWQPLGSKTTGVRQLSTRQDIAAFEVMTSSGIAIKNATTSFCLEKSL